jgi:hypothetical protein
MDIGEEDDRAASKVSNKRDNGSENGGASAPQSIEESSELEVSTSDEGVL